MRRTRGLLLLTGALAVAGLVLVVVGQGSDRTETATLPGWVADLPTDTRTVSDDPWAAYSSTLQITFDDDGTSTTTLVGLGVLGLALVAGAAAVVALRRSER